MPPIRSRAAEEGSFQIPLCGVPLILALLYVCLFSGLGALGLVGPDEPRYAAIARAMAGTHDWITPRLWGAPWFEKPVLYYWAAGIAMRVFGTSEFSARLPSALAALLATGAVTWTALRSYGVSAAWFALLMLPSSAAIIGFSRAASPDMLFAGLLAAAMAAASEMLQKPRPGCAQRIAFGLFLGAAVLAKGPAAVILAGGATLLWAAISGNWRASLRFLHPLVIAAFCIAALPWYILCALRNPDFLRIFLWQHNFERYLTPVFQHRQPFWFYAPILAIASVPWIVMAISLLFTKWDKSQRRNSPGIFFLCWALFPFLFFSLSQSKLPGYILPSVPALFLLVGRAVERALARNRYGFRVLTGMTGAMFVVTAFVFDKTFRETGNVFSVPGARVVFLLVLAGLGGLIAVGLSVGDKPVRAFVSLALLVAALVVILDIEILPAANPRVSARRAANDSLRLNPSGNSVEVYELARDWQYGMNYYFGRELPEWVPGTPLPEWLLTNERAAVELRRLGDQIHQVSRAGAPYAVLIHVSPAGGTAP